MTEQRNIWDTWNGKRVATKGRPGYKAEQFIATTDAQWAIRLRIWKNNLDNGCPCPMPKGHIMFNGKDDYYSVISND